MECSLKKSEETGQLMNKRRSGTCLSKCFPIIVTLFDIISHRHFCSDSDVFLHRFKYWFVFVGYVTLVNKHSQHFYHALTSSQPRSDLYTADSSFTFIHLLWGENQLLWMSQLKRTVCEMQQNINLVPSNSFMSCVPHKPSISWFILIFSCLELPYLFTQSGEVLR